jgi:TolB-like protein
MKKLFTYLIVILVCVSAAVSQPRIAIFPFQNMDGNMKFNIWCYNLQDSLSKALQAIEGASGMYYIIPADSVEILLTEMNIDPSNPQFETDMWVAAKKLNAKFVLSGNFNYQAERFLINAYIYNIRTKLAVTQYQARDIFKSEATIYESVNMITEALLPYFKKSN